MLYFLDLTTVYVLIVDVEVIGAPDHITHTVGKILLVDGSVRLQRPQPDITQHSQVTDIYAPGGIRNRNPSKRAAADPRIRLRGHWDGRL